jgi:hypothetical protein
MEKTDGVRILVAELERCLAARTGALSQADIDQQFAAQRVVMRQMQSGQDLARFGLAVLRAMNARMRREVELHNPARRLDGPSTFH